MGNIFFHPISGVISLLMTGFWAHFVCLGHIESAWFLKVFRHGTKMTDCSFFSALFHDELMICNGRESISLLCLRWMFYPFYHGESPLLPPFGRWITPGKLAIEGETPPAPKSIHHDPWHPCKFHHVTLQYHTTSVTCNVCCFSVSAVLFSELKFLFHHGIPFHTIFFRHGFVAPPKALVC